MRIERDKLDTAYKSGGALALACGLVLLSASGANGDAFGVTQWLLSAGASVSGGPSDATFFTTVTNPFSDSHSVSLTSPPASAMATYSFAWDGTLGTFHADTAQTAGGNPNLFADSDGDVRIDPFDGLTLEVDGLYEYALAGGDRTAEMHFAVVAFPGGGVVWSHTDLAMPIIGDPPSGVFELHETISLPDLAAGMVYRLRYDFELRSFSGSPSAISTGTGSATFTITPEPSSGIGLLAFALLASRGRLPHR